MPGPNFFNRLGLFVVKDFFDPRLCTRFRSEMCSSPRTSALVVDGNTFLEKVKKDVRRTKEAGISATTVSFVKDRLAALKPMLENHFNVALIGCEKPQFLVYNEGDFFRPHQDGDENASKPEYITKRQVSVVMFLNDADQESGPESYGGGALTFYGLIDDPPWKQCAFPLMSELGLLIAFRSNIVHEVRPVTRGERYTITSWFF